MSEPKNALIPVHFSLGSNLGDREQNLRLAVGALSQVVDITAVSSVYRTSPWGKTDLPEFLNIAVSGLSDKTPWVLLQVCLEIETLMGRERTGKWEPRKIDIDLLFAGENIISEEKIIVPHPLLHLRKFVLLPLTEIAPHFVHPVLNLSVRELLQECKDECSVELLMEW